MGWVDVGGVDVGVWGIPHACRHAHTHMNICMLNMINMYVSMGAAIGNFYTCIFFCYACVYTCVHLQVCGGMWGAHPDTPLPISTPAKAQGAQITKYAIKLE